MIGYQAYLGRYDQSGTEIDEYLCGKQIELTLQDQRKPISYQSRYLKYHQK